MPRRVVSAEEAKLWREAMRGVTPFPDRVSVEEVAPPPGPATSPPAPPRPDAAPPLPRAPAESRQALAHGSSSNLDKNSLSRLKKGQLVIEASLDLHGFTQDAAHAALWRFVTDSAERGRRCLLVVTGKGLREGAGVLRTQVPRWLNESTLRPLVLAFAYAQPRHGGEGALYILLKRRR
jgi:DNA-nicking Smr family endonuclease